LFIWEFDHPSAEENVCCSQEQHHVHRYDALMVQNYVLVIAKYIISSTITRGCVSEKFNLPYLNLESSEE